MKKYLFYAWEIFKLAAVLGLAILVFQIVGWI